MTTIILEHVKNILSDLGVARAVREQRFGDQVETRVTYLDESGRRLLPHSQTVLAIIAHGYDAELAALFSDVDEDKSDEVKYAATSLDTKTGEITQSYTSLDMDFSLGASIDIAKEAHDIASHGIDRFLIAYEGSDGDGRFENSSAMDNQGRTIHSFSSHRGHDQALDLAYEIIGQIEPEWDLGQGSRGEIQIESSSGEVRLTHTDFATQEDRHHAGYISLVQLVAPQKEREQEQDIKSFGSPRP